jgi:hypothetical protein
VRTWLTVHTWLLGGALLTRMLLLLATVVLCQGLDQGVEGHAARAKLACSAYASSTFRFFTIVVVQLHEAISCPSNQCRLLKDACRFLQ